MGQRRYPPLKLREILAIVKALGFGLKRQIGSHAHYEREASEGRLRAVVTIDMAYSDFQDERLLKYIIAQTGFSRDQFYNAVADQKKRKKAISQAEHRCPRCATSYYGLSDESEHLCTACGTVLVLVLSAQS